MPPYHRRTHRRIYVRRHFTESLKIITWNATISPTGTPTTISPSAFHRKFKNNYLKCHPINDGHTDGHKSVGISHKNSKIITWNATLSPTGTPMAICPLAFHRKFENNYLKCHPITDGHTDEFKSVGKLSAGQFYR
jgi:hypothetical protein